MNIIINKTKDFAKKLGVFGWVKVALIVIVLIGVIVYFYQSKNTNKTQTISNTTTSIIATSIKKVSTTNSPTKSKTAVVSNSVSNTMSKCNFKVISPSIGSSVSFPLKVTGIINTLDKSKGCVWNISNKNHAGDAEVFYNKNGTGWVSAGTAVPIMTEGIPGFASTTLSFTIPFNLYTYALGLTVGTPIKIVFTEQNVPPHPNPQTFYYLVYLK